MASRSGPCLGRLPSGASTRVASSAGNSGRQDLSMGRSLSSFAAFDRNDSTQVRCRDVYKAQGLRPTYGEKGQLTTRGLSRAALWISTFLGVISCRSPVENRITCRLDDPGALAVAASSTVQILRSSSLSRDLLLQGNAQIDPAPAGSGWGMRMVSLGHRFVVELEHLGGLVLQLGQLSGLERIRPGDQVCLGICPRFHFAKLAIKKEVISF